MDWNVVQRVTASGAELRRAQGTFGKELKTLVALLDHGDVLVAFAAKEELQKSLGDSVIEPREAHDIVRELLTAPTAAWREISGFRFQLLRELIKMESARDDEERTPFIQAILESLEVVLAAVYNVVGGCNVAVSGRYETLIFMRELTQFMLDLESVEISSMSTLTLFMNALVGKTLVQMDYDSQPTFVSCAVLGVITGFHKLVSEWRENSDGNEADLLAGLYSGWLEGCLVWVVNSSCTTEAWRHLSNERSSTASTEEAFISSNGQYSFLQQWLLCVSSIGAALLSSPLLARGGTDTISRAQERPLKFLGKLPARRKLFIVISEEDDVMVEVLGTLSRLVALADASSGVFSQLSRQNPWTSSLLEYMAAEYNPDLLFADFVDNLERDHLVLLDLLVSNETQMLKYLVWYLRRLSSNWEDSKKKLDSQERLEGVLSVLIRLRMEIDRLVSADLFPYNAKPLTRRLLAIEQLYEQNDEVL